MPITTPEHGKVTVSQVLNQPKVIEAVIGDELEKTLAAETFAGSTARAEGGAVLYQRAAGRLDLETKTPVPDRTEGAEYALIETPTPDVIRDNVRDLGSAFEITDEAQERNVLPVLRNAIQSVAVSLGDSIDAMVTDVLDQATAGDRTIASTSGWESFETVGASPTPRGQQPLGDLVRLDESFRNEGLNLHLAKIIVNPADAANLRIGYGAELPQMLAALGDGSPVDLITSTHVDAGAAYAVANDRNIGGLGIERPLTVERVPFRERRTTRVITYFVGIPYISRPYAIRRLTGLSS